ncbi:hypothetical protein [Fodinicurvata sediminis]|uniref:hypothetical protein n=1 Tax=Fodinicurvata sediminis TaxID=1121832 RepID=UPI0003B3D708|nr:hypothetical protein [Fodinicurvata sediminis]
MSDLTDRIRGEQSGQTGRTPADPTDNLSRGDDQALPDLRPAGTAADDDGAADRDQASTSGPQLDERRSPADQEPVLIPEEDDLSKAYREKLRETSPHMEYLRKRRREREAEAAGGEAARADSETGAGAEGPDAAPQSAAGPDGDDGGLWDQTLDTAGDVASDVGTGVTIDLPRSVAGGVRDFARNTIDAVDDLAGWLDANVADLSYGEDVTVELPEIPEPRSMTGQGIRDVTAFLTGFLPALRALRAARGTGAAGAARQVSTGRKVAEAAGAGAVADALAFDPEDPNLASLIEAVPALENPVTEYLATGEAEGESADARAAERLEGRIKNALVGSGVGVVADGVVLGLRALRNARSLRQTAGEDAESAARALEEEADRPTDLYDRLGDTARPLVELPEDAAAREATEAGTGRAAEDGLSGQTATDDAAADAAADATEAGTGRQAEAPQDPWFGLDPEEVAERADRYLNGRVSVKDLPFRMNWAKVATEEDLQTAVRRVAGLFKGRIDDARRGRISDEALQDLAGRLDMTPEDLLARQGGDTWNAEEMVAARAVLESSAENLTELARVARGSTDNKDLYQFQRMMALHGALQKQFQGAASEAGRALRALQLPTGSRARQLLQINETLEQTGGGPDQVRKLAHAMSEISDPALLDKAARGSIGQRVTDSLIEAWYFALLSGPKTHAVNIASSGVFSLYRIPERALASRIGRAFGGDGVADGEAAAMAYGLVHGFRDALRLAGRAFRTGEPSDVFGKVETRREGAVSAENFGLEGVPGKALDLLGGVLRLPTRALMAQDEFFRVIGKSMQTRATALRQARQEGLEGDALVARVNELLENPSDQMLDDALAFSRSLTFTRPLGDAGQSLQRAVNNMPAAKFVLPFIRTPVNLMKEAGSRTPFALLNPTVQADLRAGGAARDLALAKISMGSMLMLTAADLALSGVVTGSGPQQPELKAAWRRSGKQPYSVKVGDTWYSYSRADPFGMILGLSADYAQIAGQISEKDAAELVAAGTLAVSNNVTSKTWLQGPADLMDAITDPDRYGERWLQRFTGTLVVPTGPAQVASTMDPTQRAVWSIRDAIVSRVPGYSETLPPRRNLWGEPVVLEGGLGPDIISPIYKQGEKDSPIDEEMIRLDLGVQLPTKTIEEIELEPEEYDRYVQLAGNGAKDPSTGLGAYDTLNGIMEGSHPLSGRYASATDEMKRTMIRRVIGEFRDLAREQVMQEFPELSALRRERWEEQRRAVTGSPAPDTPEGGAEPRLR